MVQEPPANLIRSPDDAEEAAAAWLRYFGFHDAQRTPRGKDGGVDVAAGDVVAQVKAEMKPIGRPVVQQIFGVATLEGKAAAVFALSGFTDEAMSWAAEAGVALFEFDLQGVPTPRNGPADRLRTSRAETTDAVDELQDRLAATDDDLAGDPIAALKSSLRAINGINVIWAGETSWADDGVIDSLYEAEQQRLWSALVAMSEADIDYDVADAIAEIPGFDETQPVSGAEFEPRWLGLVRRAPSYRTTGLDIDQHIVARSDMEIALRYCSPWSVLPEDREHLTWLGPANWLIDNR